MAWHLCQIRRLRTIWLGTGLRRDTPRDRCPSAGIGRRSAPEDQDKLRRTVWHLCQIRGLCTRCPVPGHLCQIRGLRTRCLVPGFRRDTPRDRCPSAGSSREGAQEEQDHIQWRGWHLCRIRERRTIWPGTSLRRDTPRHRCPSAGSGWRGSQEAFDSRPGCGHLPPIF